ncbi:MAG: rod shape-determining protein MreC [Halocynthiibacter sp.]
MATTQDKDFDYVTPLKRLLVGGLVTFLLILFVLWRIDSPRADRMRNAMVDRFLPSFSWVIVPITAGRDMLRDFQSYQRIFEQNNELRRELQRMKAWKEAAIQLEQENARLLALNNVRLNPKLTFVTGQVMADSGSPFRQSLILNVGARDGVHEGWATMDGLGLVGRISGVGKTTARVLLLTDVNSRVPVRIQPSGLRAILVGDNSFSPVIEFVERPEDVRPGDRIVTSGEGGVFPPDLLIGQIVLGADKRLRSDLAADYQRLNYLRVLRAHDSEKITERGGIIAPRTKLPTVPAISTDKAPEEDSNG